MNLDRLYALTEAKVPNYRKSQKCKYCNHPAKKSLIWADGRAYVPACSDGHIKKAQRKVGEVGKTVTMASWPKH